MFIYPLDVSAFSYTAFQKKDSYLAVIPRGIHNDDELLSKLEESLQFPYFGMNWNALWDVLLDFEWISNEYIVLEHKDLPHIGEENLKIYLEILHDTVKTWQKEKEHKFIVIFPKEEKLEIERILHKIS